MHAERDLLTRFVFPELRARAQHLFVNVRDVDLRWGVSQDDAQSRRSLSLRSIFTCLCWLLSECRKSCMTMKLSYVVQHSHAHTYACEHSTILAPFFRFTWFCWQFLEKLLRHRVYDSDAFLHTIQYLHHYHNHFSCCFPDEPGLASFPLVSSFTCSRRAPMVISVIGFLWIIHHSCHPTNSVKALR